MLGIVPPKKVSRNDFVALAQQPSGDYFLSVLSTSVDWLLREGINMNSDDTRKILGAGLPEPMTNLAEGKDRFLHRHDATGGGHVTEEMVNRFLRWQVPQSVCSDLCMSDANYRFPRAGTCIMGPDEARAMLEFVLASPPSAEGNSK